MVAVVALERRRDGADYSGKKKRRRRTVPWKNRHCDGQGGVVIIGNIPRIASDFSLES
jgi:hypothetical protein